LDEYPNINHRTESLRNKSNFRIVSEYEQDAENRREEQANQINGLNVILESNSKSNNHESNGPSSSLKNHAHVIPAKPLSTME